MARGCRNLTSPGYIHFLTPIPSLGHFKTQVYKKSSNCILFRRTYAYISRKRDTSGGIKPDAHSCALSIPHGPLLKGESWVRAAHTKQKWR